MLRTARALLAAKIPAKRIRRSLESLRRELPESMPLSGLAISAVGDHVVVRDGAARWQAEGGQYVLGLDVSLQNGVLHVVEHTRERPGCRERVTPDWFGTGTGTREQRRAGGTQRLCPCGRGGAAERSGLEQLGAPAARGRPYAGSRRCLPARARARRCRLVAALQPGCAAGGSRGCGGCSARVPERARGGSGFRRLSLQSRAPVRIAGQGATRDPAPRAVPASGEQRRAAERTATPMRLWVGTSGYNYPEWKGSFYPLKMPAAKMLPYYAERFSTVEINYTFYRVPNAKILASWDLETPAGFRLTLKAPKRITHIAKLTDCAELHRLLRENRRHARTQARRPALPAAALLAQGPRGARGLPATAARAARARRSSSGTPHGWTRRSSPV